MSKPIIAQCPACNARYSVTPGQLRVADGQVRCGQCLTVFNAIAKTGKDLPASAKTKESDIAQQAKTSKASFQNQPPQEKSRQQKPNYHKQDEKPVDQSETSKTIKVKRAPSQAKMTSGLQHPDKRSSVDSHPMHPSLMLQIRALNIDPPELKAVTDNPTTQSWAIFGCIIAVMLLAGQYLWFERATLAKDPALTPIYRLACQQINCTLSTASGLSDLNSTHLLVREVADQPDTLELLTGIRNTLNLPVHLPTLRLQFTDINGRVIAARDITATTYRPETEVIQPNETLDIRLVIKRPQAGHLGYEIDWIAHPSL